MDVHLQSRIWTYASNVPKCHACHYIAFFQGAGALWDKTFHTHNYGSICTASTGTCPKVQLSNPKSCDPQMLDQRGFGISMNLILRTYMYLLHCYYILLLQHLNTLEHTSVSSWWESEPAKDDVLRWNQALRSLPERRGFDQVFAGKDIGKDFQYLPIDFESTSRSLKYVDESEHHEGIKYWHPLTSINSLWCNPRGKPLPSTVFLPSCACRYRTRRIENALSRLQWKPISSWSKVTGRVAKQTNSWETSKWLPSLFSREVIFNLAIFKLQT